MSQGLKFRDAIKNNKPLIIPGTINAYSAKLAEKANHQAIYLSGSGVAAASYGLPDLGITSMHDVLIDVKRITNATSLPLLVDIDTGWGDAKNIAETIREMDKSGCAAVHIEDQIFDKRCGHRPNKQIISISEMKERLKVAVDSKIDESFFIMARTDALATEGIDGTIERCGEYLEEGADGIFLEAVTSMEEYKKFKDNFNAPLLANITEFGKTPLFSQKELKDSGVDIVLYPLTAFRAMSLSAEKIYNSIIKDGTQEPLLDIMQTREELYEVLDYYNFEKKLDEQVIVKKEDK
jgi:methylisocitrate lyase|tara:strand:+ start:1161 stop:2042 length:882 start_codon:yes stop_codon:yes gene_type:complete